MKSSGQAVLVVVVLVLGGYAAQTLAAETPPPTADNQEECVVDEQADCAARCLTEHNCCIKSCNWVEAKKKSKCIKQCKSDLKKCYRACDEHPVAD